MGSLDLLIEGGFVIDGSGSPGFKGDVGISGDVVTIFRDAAPDIEVKNQLDASGKIICPGFIDLHAHSGLVILAEPEHESKVHQGVTTELIGVDGNSYAPFENNSDLEMFIKLNSGLDGDPDIARKWRSVGEYLSQYDNRVAVNIAYIVGNSPLRIGAVGWENRPPSSKELENMRALLRESLEEGAIGISTGLDYPPGSYASTDELVVLCSDVARMGGIYHTHVRNHLGDRYLDPFREAIEIGRRSCAPVHLTHLVHRKNNPGGAMPILDLIEEARGQGLDVTFDDFPFQYGGTRALVVFPDWAHEGGPGKLTEVLQSEEGRERLRRVVEPQGKGWDDMRLTHFKQPHNFQYEGKSIAYVSEILGKHPVDTLCDLLLDEDLRTCYVADVVDEKVLDHVLRHPSFMAGSDAMLLGDYPPPSAYGAYPTILGKLVRGQGKLTFGEAVNSMTFRPATRLGLKDRGLLKTGMKADIVVFDPTTVNGKATRDNPRQLSTGIDFVIVNGVVVIENGRHTGRLPGSLLKPRGM